MGKIRRFLEVAVTGALSLDLPIYFSRPTALDTAITQFLVVYLPSGIREREIGGHSGGYDWSTCTVAFEVFVRDNMKASIPNDADIPSIDTIIDALMDVFPIVDREHDVVISKPRIVIPASSDGNGFHYSRLHASLSTAA